LEFIDWSTPSLILSSLSLFVCSSF
jgi:hypothetical protein